MKPDGLRAKSVAFMFYRGLLGVGSTKFTIFLAWGGLENMSYLKNYAFYFIETSQTCSYITKNDSCKISENLILSVIFYRPEYSKFCFFS